MGQIKFIVSIAFIALFAVAIVTFSFQFGEDNNAAILLANDPDFSSIRTEMQSNLSQFTEDFNSSSKTFTETTQKLGDQSATSGGQFKIGIGTLKNVMTSAMKGGSAKFFGNDTGFGIFLTVIGVIVAWIGILYGWKAWKGNPD